MFWDWINNKNGGGNIDWKRYVAIIILVFVIPIVVYELIAWDPIIGTDERGEPYKLGLFVVMGLFWFAIYEHNLKHKMSERLNSLIDKLLDEDQREDVVDRAKIKSEQIEQNKNTLYGGTDRVRWFNIE